MKCEINNEQKRMENERWSVENNYIEVNYDIQIKIVVNMIFNQCSVYKIISKNIL
jgi:hypothetical protein